MELNRSGSALASNALRSDAAVLGSNNWVNSVARLLPSSSELRSVDNVLLSNSELRSVDDMLLLSNSEPRPVPSSSVVKGFVVSPGTNGAHGRQYVPSTNGLKVLKVAVVRLVRSVVTS